MATLTDAFISLNDIINNFLISYTGPGKLIPDAKRTEVVFHARRCLQEFAYETLKSQMNSIAVLPATDVVGSVTASRFSIPSDSVSTINIKRSSASGGITYTVAMTQGTVNPPTNVFTYYIDYINKTVNFISSLVGFGISYNYLSNALTTDETAAIPKLAEEALYSCMIYAILANRENTNGNLLQRLLIEKIDKLERSKSRLIFTNFS